MISMWTSFKSISFQIYHRDEQMLRKDSFEEPANDHKLVLQISGNTHILSQPLLSAATTEQYW
jgi:hypothetical protein